MSSPMILVILTTCIQLIYLLVSSNEYSSNESGEIPGVQILMNDQASKYGAYCLDGSVPDFYYRQGSVDGINKFHIYLEGGGWIYSIESSAERAGTSLGSSKYDAPSINIAAGAPYLSSQQNINPLTYNWNSVYIRYCDGSSYSSNNETIYPYNATLNLYFRGWRILNGVLNTLVEKYNLSTATDVLFSGCSAGALGVFYHADYIYQYISNVKQKDAFNYMAMPDAGYFMEAGCYVGCMQFNWLWGNVTIGLNDNCVNYYNKNDMNVYECMWAANIAPFVNVKMFSTQSQFDSNQIACVLKNTNNVTIINEYGKNVTDSYETRYINTNNKHYGWLVSCYQHCNFGLSTWNNITIHGYTISEAQVNAWFNNATYGNLLFQNKTYPCNTCC